jgi:hypothetical protein
MWLLARWITQKEEPKERWWSASLVSKIIEKTQNSYWCNIISIVIISASGKGISRMKIILIIQLKMFESKLFKYLLIDKPTFESTPGGLVILK